jgi:hypothetical protein
MYYFLFIKTEFYWLLHFFVKERKKYWFDVRLLVHTLVHNSTNMFTRTVIRANEETSSQYWWSEKICFVFCYWTATFSLLKQIFVKSGIRIFREFNKEFSDIKKCAQTLNDSACQCLPYLIPCYSFVTVAYLIVSVLLSYRLLLLRHCEKVIRTLLIRYSVATVTGVT